MQKDKITLVMPCYNEEEALPHTLPEVEKLMASIPEADFEVILVDNCSKDSTLSIMRAAHERDSRFHYISFSRNFGKDSSMYAGLAASTGDYVTNLSLSQQRAYAVAEYLLYSMDRFLTAEESAQLMGKLSANGKSMSNPILDGAGNVDNDASRRVEIKFRLTDEEMLSELQKLVSDGQEISAAAAAGQAQAAAGEAQTVVADEQQAGQAAEPAPAGGGEQAVG